MQLRFKRFKESITSDVLEKIGIPEELHPFYDFTGKFKYEQDYPLRLSLENGDEPLKTIKMNWISSNESRIEFVSEEHFNGLVKAMEKMRDLNLLVYVTTKNKEKVLNKLKQLEPQIKKRIGLVIKEDDVKMDFWAQDTTKPITEGDQLVTVRPLEKNDPNTIELKSNRIIKIKDTPFYFEGGNVVVGSKHIFVGEDTITKNMKLYEISYMEALNALEEEFGKPIIVLDQIDYHIDLTLAVVRNNRTGKEDVLLSSPKKAAELISQSHLLEKLLKEGAEFETKGEKDLNSFFGFVAKNDERQISMNYRSARLLRLKEKLMDLGYNVHDMPDLSLVHDYRRIKSEHRSENYKNRSASVFNYTNAIFSKNEVLVPETGVKIFDDYVYNIMRLLGKEPIPLPAGQHSICFMGGIRCMSETFRQKLSDELIQGKNILEDESK